VELRQLEYFLAVVEYGSFTGAAAHLYMGQSGLSASLLGLERELGTELFIRGRRGAELTDAGRAFLEPARAAVAAVHRAREAVSQVTGVLGGSVRIATVPVPKRVDILQTIRDFHEHHPGVDIHVVHDGAKDMLELVADSRVDFAVTPPTVPMSPTLRYKQLLSSCPSARPLIDWQGPGRWIHGRSSTS
jgi:DNA-binding transcriptional LysR family regulator